MHLLRKDEEGKEEAKEEDEETITAMVAACNE